MRTPWILACAAIAAFASAIPAPASAQVSIAAGGVLTSAPSGSGGGVMLSSSTAVPSLPLQVQGTVFAPLTTGGGYAATGEIRGLSGGGFGGAYIGGGLGFGRLPGAGTTGGVFTAFVGKPIAPSTTVEVRFYDGTSVGSKGLLFVGLRFSL